MPSPRAARLTVALAAPHVGIDVGRRRLSLLPREATTPPGFPHHREESSASSPGTEARMEQDQVASLLEVFEGGDRDALDRLLPLVYDELRRIAHRELRRERRDHTLSTTDVVHEAYLKLIDHQRVTSGEQVRFLAVAATAVRRALVEHARRRDAAKRGGGQRPVTLDEEAFAVGDGGSEDLLSLDEALTRLAALDERLARVVECRYFGGLTEDETAAALGVTARTVRRDWVKARGWLFRELHGEVS
jgi:RNA polymerase sigma factor (TIGR02999 family)